LPFPPDACAAALLRPRGRLLIRGGQRNGFLGPGFFLSLARPTASLRPAQKQSSRPRNKRKLHASSRPTGPPEGLGVAANLSHRSARPQALSLFSGGFLLQSGALMGSTGSRTRQCAGERNRSLPLVHFFPRSLAITACRRPRNTARVFLGPFHPSPKNFVCAISRSFSRGGWDGVCH